MIGCSGGQVSASDIAAAVNALPATRRNILLGYEAVGSFAQSPSLSTGTPTPEADRKLWIIGAVLGPVFFALLLIGLLVFLHYKCRPRGENRSFAQVYTLLSSGLFLTKLSIFSRLLTTLHKHPLVHP